MAAVHTRPWDVPQEEKVPWNKAVHGYWRELVKTGSLPTRWSRAPAARTPLSADPTIAFVITRRLALHHWLLVFDEMLNVSSAVLLADVMSWFWRMGGVVVGTSNKVPDDLYRNSVQRERLEPFVETLKVWC
jgi:protein AFG1